MLHIIYLRYTDIRVEDNLLVTIKYLRHSLSSACTLRNYSIKICEFGGRCG